MKCMQADASEGQSRSIQGIPRHPKSVSFARLFGEARHEIWLRRGQMGNCLSSSDYITPAPANLLPDPAGASTFTLSRNACLSSNCNVYKGTEDNPPLWLFLHVKGVPNGVNNSYLVLENFWRPPFSDEGDVLCWCHLPAYQRNGAYCSSGYEEYGMSPDLYSEVYWSDTLFAQEPGSTPMVLWIRREWNFFVKVGFYRDRYMEEPLGVLEISSKGWTVNKIGGPSKCLQQPSKEVKEVRYVFKDKQGLRFPIELDMSTKDSLKVISYDSCLFSCTVTPSCSWVSDRKLIISTRPENDASLALLVGFVCANVLSPESIVANLRVSQLSRKLS